MDSDRRHVARLVTQTLLEFAADLTVKSGGSYQPTDVARMLLAAGVVLMSNDLGRAPTVQYLRELATALDAGATPAEFN